MEKEEKLKLIKKEIIIALENCTCLGKDAYGEYINKLTEALMIKIKELEGCKYSPPSQH